MNILTAKVAFIHRLKEDDELRTEWKAADHDGRKDILRREFKETFSNAEINFLDDYTHEKDVSDDTLNEEIRRAEEGDVNAFWG